MSEDNGTVHDTDPLVRMETSEGTLVIELWPAKAPATVANFLAYVDNGHYEGTIFHRVISSFMLQGGGFTADMEQKSTLDPVKNEATSEVKNIRGTLSMARTMVVDSATSQFFVNVVDNEFLDHRDESAEGFGYCVFAQVIEGMDVVDKIRGVDTHSAGPHDDVPVEPVTIDKVERIQE